nr:hypothetical protein CFP56_15176 [Quercus suber]
MKIKSIRISLIWKSIGGIDETTAANDSTSSSATATPLFHLLLGNYLKILNKFLGQYGHGINHLDSFKIWEVDAAKNELETQNEWRCMYLGIFRTI